MTSAPRVLLIGYGNPGRLDDGLGPALAETVEKMQLPNVTVDIDYQLIVEDAALIAEHDIVIFADASTDCPEPFFFQSVTPRPALGFSSHSMEPETVMALAAQLFDRVPQGYTLGIRGHKFNDFGEVISEPAQKNLNQALRFIVDLLKNQSFIQAAEQYKWHHNYNPAQDGD